MKIAIVVDSLIEFGGAERVLISLLKTFPRVDIYTSVVNDAFKRKYFSGTKITTITIPQRFFARHTSLYQSFSPLLWHSLDFHEYDLVLAISGHMMSNLVNPGRALFIQYLLTPPKNIYFQEPKTNLQKIFPYHVYIRPLFERALKKTPYLLTLSRHVQQVFHTTCGVDPVVLYPPVHIPRRLPKRNKGKYYLIVSRLDRAKSIELAIEACNILHEQLMIVGVSNDPAYDRLLRAIAGPTITFVGFQTNEQIQNYYTHAKAFLFTPKNEDFGIAPIEALAYGVPVLAYYGGGAKETMVHGQTGLFFYKHTKEALMKAMRSFRPSHFIREDMYIYAKRFSEKYFQKKLQEYIFKTASTEVSV